MNTDLASPLATSPAAPARAKTVLSVRDLRVSFAARDRSLVAVDGVSFDLAEGEILGIVGESGSGKSITLRAILGIARPRGSVSGSVIWNGSDLVTLREDQLRRIRGREIAMIFQEPMSSLNPLLTVGLQIDENLRAHGSLGRAERRRRAIELLDMVGIPGAARRLGDYPHEFSGGMRQRVMIAIALASSPRLLLADEPTTALDVTIQDQILRLLQTLSVDLGMSVVLVTHDIGVVAETCDRVAVMYGGRFAEIGSTGGVIDRPRHPYTRGLLESIPRHHAPRTPLFSIPGTPPSIGAMPAGCAFFDRCGVAMPVCAETKPLLVGLSDDHRAACHNLERCHGEPSNA